MFKMLPCRFGLLQCAVNSRNGIGIYRAAVLSPGYFQLKDSGSWRAASRQSGQNGWGGTSVPQY